MRLVIQKVKEAKVEIEGITVAQIQKGYLILLGITEGDTQSDIQWLSKKTVNMRLFEDQNGVMNKSIHEVDGEIIVVSQFTLYASTKKGNRPSYIKAAKPDIAIPLYNSFLSQIETDLGKEVGAGSFGAMMQVHLVNDGPTTIIIDSTIKE